MRRITVLCTALLLALGMMATPAAAGHAHDIDTPGPKCVSNVGRGQTSITDATHGGYHRFHNNVHLGATENTDNLVLGKGNSRVKIGLGICGG